MNSPLANGEYVSDIFLCLKFTQHWRDWEGNNTLSVGLLPQCWHDKILQVPVPPSIARAWSWDITKSSGSNRLWKQSKGKATSCFGGLTRNFPWEYWIAEKILVLLHFLIWKTPVTDSASTLASTGKKEKVWEGWWEVLFYAGSPFAFIFQKEGIPITGGVYGVFFSWVQNQHHQLLYILKKEGGIIPFSNQLKLISN